jgi:hypothetical protein
MTKRVRAIGLRFEGLRHYMAALSKVDSRQPAMWIDKFVVKNCRQLRPAWQICSSFVLSWLYCSYCDYNRYSLFPYLCIYMYIYVACFFVLSWFYVPIVISTGTGNSSN